jgi:WD40 repeat protein
MSSLLHAGIRARLEEAEWTVEVVDPDAPLGVLTTVDPRDRVVICYDHFERLLSNDGIDTDSVFNVLTSLTAPGSTSVLLLGLRGDYYAAALDQPLLRETLQHHQVVVGPMTRDQLRSVITEPARKADSSVAAPLVDLLLNEAIPSGSADDRATAGALPLLAHALRETWLSGIQGSMGVADYHQTGGIAGAIDQSAEEAWAELTDDDRNVLRQVLLRLVQIHDDGRATSHPATIDELAGLTDSATLSRILEPYVARRLLTVQDNRVEISHETLLTAWRRLREAIAGAREVLQSRRRLRSATATWVDTDRRDSELARGATLAELQQAAQDTDLVQVTADEKAFLNASDAAEHEAVTKDRRTIRRLKILTATITCLAIVAVALAVVSVQARTDAAQARDGALSQQLAVTARALAAKDPALAAQIAVAAHQIQPTVEARSALLEAASTPFPERHRAGTGTTAVAVNTDGQLVAISDADEQRVLILQRSDSGYARAGQLDLTSPGAYGLAFSPANDLLAVGEFDGSVRLWDLADPSNPSAVSEEMAGPQAAVQQVAFSPDGSHVAAVGAGDGVFRWDVTDLSSPTELPLLPVPGDVTWDLAYSPDGRWLAAGGSNGAVRLFETTAPNLTVELPVSSIGSAGAVAFSPDSQLLAVGHTTGGEFRVFDLSEPENPELIEDLSHDFTSWVNATAFSADGAHVVAASSDATLRVWEVASGREVNSLPHPAQIGRMDSTGDVLVTGSVDGFARIWSWSDIVRWRFEWTSYSIGFSSSGDRLAVVTGDEAPVWRVPDQIPALWQPTSMIGEAPGALETGGLGALSLDGTLLARGTTDGQAWLYEVAETGLTRVPMPQGESAGVQRGFAFSADNRLLAAGGDDTWVRLWDLQGETPALAATIEPGRGVVRSIAFHPTRHEIAVATDSGDVSVYDVSRPDAPEELSATSTFNGEAFGVAYHPGGDVLALSSNDRTVALYDVSDPRTPTTIGDHLTGPVSRVYRVAFDATGDRMAATATDGTLWVWDTSDPATPQVWARITVSSGWAAGLGLHPDGHTAVVGDNGVIWTYTLDPTTAAAAICARSGDPITEAEWRTHLGDVEFTPPCGKE